MAGRGPLQKVTICYIDPATGEMVPAKVVDGELYVNVQSGGQPEAVDETGKVTSTNATASGNTLVLNVGGTERGIVYQVYVATGDAFAPVTFYLRFGAAGTARYTTHLVSIGSRIPNVTTTPIKGGTGEDLYINLSGVSDLEVTVVWGVE